MSAPSAIIHHGSASSAVLESDQTTVNIYGLDEGRMIYWSANEDALSAGAADPTYSGMKIERLTKSRDGELWTFECAILGLKGGKSERHLKGSPEVNLTATDWDTVNIKLVTSNPTKYRPGQMIGGYGLAFVVMDSQSSPLDSSSGWYNVTARLMGIKTNKPRTRQISGTAITITGDSITWPATGGGNNWDTAIPAEVQISSVTVVDEFISTFPPPTEDTPGIRTPPDTPSIKLFNLTLTNARTYWPNGWSFVPAAQQLVSGVSLYKHQWTYTWRPEFLPK